MGPKKAGTSAETKESSKGCNQVFNWVEHVHVVPRKIELQLYPSQPPPLSSSMSTSSSSTTISSSSTSILSSSTSKSSSSYQHRRHQRQHQWEGDICVHLIMVVSLKKTCRRERSPSRSKSWFLFPNYLSFLSPPYDLKVPINQMVFHNWSYISFSLKILGKLHFDSQQINLR